MACRHVHDQNRVSLTSKEAKWTESTFHGLDIRSRMIKRQSCQLHSAPLTFNMNKCIENMDMRLFPSPSPDDTNVLCCFLSSSFETLAFFLAVKRYSLDFQPSLEQSAQEIPIMCPADISPQEVSQDIAFSHQVRSHEDALHSQSWTVPAAVWGVTLPLVVNTNNHAIVSLNHKGFRHAELSSL